MREFGGHIPTAIQILADQIAAIVAQEYAIRIHHWHNFEHEILSQHQSNRMSAQ